jgi:ElaB/YqjD/DUF883 family membrane-anchored ribosome-binding protein
MKAQKSLNALADQVEELLAVLRRHPSPDVDEVSARVQDALDSAKHAIKRPSLPARLGRYANSLDHYVTGYPRLGFLTGIMLGSAVVHLANLGRPRSC